jgi:NAD(P)-dependent dehydrogenase (short-subunit alcohol dehydrogenase family)
MKTLDGKVAIVTGASSGIGKAAALAFAQEGAKVVVADIDDNSGKLTVQKIKNEGGEAIIVKTDVSKALDVRTMVNKTIETYGRLDCAFNNAGVTTVKTAPIADYDEEEWDNILAINMKGVWLCMKYEIQQMLKYGGGTIVNTASVAGFVGFANSCAYVTSKHAVLGLTRAAAVEYAKDGIRVNAICPGSIQTPLIEHVIALGGASPIGPIGRIGTPEEIAKAVVWLSSDAASYAVGHAMVLDGGWLIT